MTKFESKKYEKIVKELVKSSYPILKNRKIIIKKSFFSGHRYSATTRRVFSRLFIFINPKYDIYNNFELKGLLAHELCHLEDFAKMGFFEMIIHGIKYLFSLEYREKYEKATDKAAICKGYRRELLASRKKRYSIKDKNMSKSKKYYLTPSEIKKFVC